LPQGKLLRGKNFIITGGNSGCGWELCRWLAINGKANRVYMVCRNVERGEKARKEIVILKELADGLSGGKSGGGGGGSSTADAEDAKSATTEDVKAQSADAANSKENESDKKEDGSLSSCLRVIPFSVDCGVKSDVDALIEFLKTDLGHSNSDSTNSRQYIHGLVCNAGALHDDIHFTRDKFETTMATHLIYGAGYLSEKLVERNVMAGCQRNEGAGPDGKGGEVEIERSETIQNSYIVNSKYGVSLAL
jgi:NAD(P)-dependent dehydrogenase (short-subunit alcohol dehydrogenase family)